MPSSICLLVFVSLKRRFCSYYQYFLPFLDESVKKNFLLSRNKRRKQIVDNYFKILIVVSVCVSCYRILSFIDVWHDWNSKIIAACEEKINAMFRFMQSHLNLWYYRFICCVCMCEDIKHTLTIIHCSITSLCHWRIFLCFPFHIIVIIALSLSLCVHKVT